MNRKFFAAALAASIVLAAVSAPALAASVPTLIPAPVREALRAEFVTPIIGEAITIRPGNVIELRVRVTGPRKNTITITGPQGWAPKPWKNVYGVRTAVFYVNSSLPAGEARFAVQGSTPDGQTCSDEIVFTSLGHQTAPASAAPASATGHHAVPAANVAPAASTTTPAASAAADKDPDLLWRAEARHQSRAIAMPGRRAGGKDLWSNNYGTLDLQVQSSGSPLVFGLQVRAAPEDAYVNPDGNAGAAAYGGLRFVPPGSTSSAEFRLGLNRDAGYRPVYAAARVAGNPGVERLAHDLRLATNFGFVGAGYSAGLRFLGEPTGPRAEIAGGGTYRYDFDAPGGSHPATWLGLRATAPVDPALWRAEVRLTAGYALPLTAWDGKSRQPDGAIIGLEIISL